MVGNILKYLCMDHQLTGSSLRCYIKITEKMSKKELMNVELWSLHIKHALKTAAESARWNIKPVFKGIFTILHDTPARGENYIAITEEERSSFFFCEAQWFGGPNC